MRMLWRLVTLYRPYALWVLLGVFLSLVTLLANMALMAASGWFITAMAIAGAGSGTMNYFTPAAIIRAAAILRTGGRYLERIVAHETTFRLLGRLRVWLFGRIEPLPPSLLDAYHNADLSNRLRADIDRLEAVYIRMLSPLLVSVIASALLLSYLGGHSWTFAVAEGAALAFAGFAVPSLLMRLTGRWNRAQVRLSNQLAEMAVDSVQGMGELLAFGPGRQRFRSRFLAVSRDLAQMQQKLGAANGLTQAALVLASNLSLFAMLVLGIPLVEGGLLERADFILVCLLSLAGFETVAALPMAFAVSGKAVESARRVFALADVPSDKPRPHLAAASFDRCDLIVSNLSFGYSRLAPAVLDGFSLRLLQGRCMAIQAPMGSGKSTLVGLLTGFYRPQSGDILLNGRSISSFDPETLRGCFAVSSQQPGLFTGTIRDNLLLAKPSASEEELWHVLGIAQLSGFVAGLPDGLDTYVGEAGLALSGGQARRLAIARALLKDAWIVILDEPGEGLDYKTERTMLQAIVDDLRGRSLLLMTHRKAGLDLMDDVAGLEKHPLPVREGGAGSYSDFLQKYQSVHS